MATNYQLLRGQRLDLKRQLKTLETRADNHIVTVRQKIDPLLDYTEMELGHAKQALISLEVIAKEAAKIQKKIDTINEQIGDDDE